ncbi:MAG: sigma-54-dependent transcriptional regulator, partial [Thermoanaerobaculia bacterium]
GIARALADGFGEADEEAAGDTAVARLRDPDNAPYDVIVTDLRLPGAGGLEVLEAARARDERSAVILMTAYGTIEAAVDAMRRGAFDFVQKPFDLEQLEVRVARALEHGRLLREVTHLRAERAARFAPENLVGTSPALQSALELVRKVAGSRSTALVTGETGTGKELVAGLIHGFSARADGPFIKVNCAALPETLLESELFGHERGAFTGADRTRIGRFEQAHGGTLFLDEIGDMDLALQAKLLKAVEEKRFRRVGDPRERTVDVRLIAATHRNLAELASRGQFRSDLYFRISTMRLEIPPLRARREDIPLLARTLVHDLATEICRREPELDDRVIDALQRYEWPGNVRELRNVLERALLLADTDVISASDLRFDFQNGQPLSDTLEDAERMHVQRVVAEEGGDIDRAAVRLGIARSTLYQKLKRYGSLASEAAAHR